MVNFIIGEKGEGKTKRLVNMANDSFLNRAEGNVVFIDCSNKHIHNLNRGIRLVETGTYKLNNYREFLAFVYGILSRDNDSTNVFVDSISKLVGKLTNEEIVQFSNALKSLSESCDVNFVVAISCDKNTAPEEIRALSL